MRRREFIALVGATALPLAARGQQSATPVVGFLRSTTLDVSQSLGLVAAFRQGLKDSGFIEGQNVQVEYRYANNQMDRLPGLVADLLGRPLSVIVADTIAAIQIKAATATLPIIFASGGDPVESGLVVRLNRPGGNVTGVVFFSTQLGAKRLELLRQLVPKAAIIALLHAHNSPSLAGERSDVEEAAKAIGQRLITMDVTNESELDSAFATFKQQGAGALLVGAGTLLNSNREGIIALAAHHELPAIYAYRDGPLAGGLMSYGSSTADSYRQAGIYAGRILKGEKPAELPVVRSTKFEFVLNLRTAKALGLGVPPTLLALADEVIE